MLAPKTVLADDKNSPAPPRALARLVGQHFAHFQPDPDIGRHNVRMGVVQTQLGADSWLLEFDAGTYRFSNVFSTSQLNQFVFFLTEPERQAFLLDLTDRVVNSLPSLKTNAGRGARGTTLIEADRA
jgi:hypothetical protein